MKVTLDIQDANLESFLSYVEGLAYVRVIEQEPSDEQKEEVLQRLEAIESGRMKTKPWDDARKNIFRR